MEEIHDRLARHAFEDLFIDRLGWDSSAGSHVVRQKQHTFVFERVAQKRGFQVFHCEVDRPTLVDRGMLRSAQKQLTRNFHEHIAIYSTNEPPKQVWQWSVRTPDGRRHRHREHPFFSATPPDAFVERISTLAFSLAEEEHLTLFDALNRVRSALDTKAELDLFARHPSYAHRIEALHPRIAEGDQSAFSEFVLLNRPLTKRHARLLRKWELMDPEDADQIAIIGLLQAVKKFRPELGYQFSTYSYHWIRQACQRFGPEFSCRIRIPPHILWPCLKFRHKVNHLIAADGPASAREQAERLVQQDRKLRKCWPGFLVATNIRSLSQRREPEYRQARNIVDPTEPPVDAAIRHEAAAALHQALRKLNPRYARILRLRYGLDDGQEHTLEATAALIGVTRERVRQLQKRAEQKLTGVLKRAGFDEIPPAPDAEPPPESPAQVPQQAPASRQLQLQLPLTMPAPVAEPAAC